MILVKWDNMYGLKRVTCQKRNSIFNVILLRKIKVNTTHV